MIGDDEGEQQLSNKHKSLRLRPWKSWSTFWESKLLTLGKESSYLKRRNYWPSEEKKTDKTACKPPNSPIDPNIKLKNTRKYCGKNVSKVRWKTYITYHILDMMLLLL